MTAAAGAVAASFAHPSSQRRVVTLDFLVTGPDGETPTDLATSNITLKIGGREREVRALELVSAPNRTPPPVAAGEKPAPETPRNIVLIVEEQTLFGLEPIVKEAIAKLLASLAPPDRVAFVSTRPNGARTNLTPVREVISKAVESIVSGPGRLGTCQREMMLFLQSFSESVPPGRSTTVAVLSRGSGSGASFKGDSESGPCVPRRDDLRTLEEAISAAQINLHFFTVHDDSRSWGFDTIAANTGGGSSLLSWANTAILEQEIRALSRYYRATFDTNEPPAERPQRVDLRINRPNHKVRTSVSIR